jgi:hypothetical protein
MQAGQRKDTQSALSEPPRQIILPKLKSDKNRGVSTHCTNALMKFAKRLLNQNLLCIQLYLINDP